MVDGAGVEGRDPAEDIEKINAELKAYNEELASRPQVIAANKMDTLPEEDQETYIELLRESFGTEIPIFPISAVSGKGVKELLYHVRGMLDELGEDRIVFEREYFPADETVQEPYTVYREDDGTFVVEGPRIERMLGYTNLESEKGFDFFQKFLKDNGILEELEALGIQEGDTVRLYGLEFDYYK
jgi:GTP-binding protein